MTSQGQRLHTAYLLSPLTGSQLREPELPLSSSLTSDTLFTLQGSRIGDARPVFSAAC